MAESKNNNSKKWATAPGIIAGKPSGLDKESKHPFRSVRFQTWVYFFLLAVLTLIVLWIFQLLFYKSAYNRMKKQEVERLGEKIISKYPGGPGDKEYDKFLRQIAFNNGLNIVIFCMQTTPGECIDGDCYSSELGFKAEYISSQFNDADFPNKGLIPVDDPRIIDGWEDFYTYIRENERWSYVKTVERGQYLYYGARLDSDGYLYMATPMQALETSVSVMSDQMLVSSLLCLVLSIVVSYFISQRITKPITEFSQVARKLGEGDYTVRFDGNGYTEIENLAETLNFATEEIGKTEQLRRDFLANVSHDLRTPLTMVKAYAEMIRDISGSDACKRTQHSQVIIDEADRLTGLVNDILNLSKLQSGTETLQSEPVALDTLVKIVIERFDVYRTRDGYLFPFETQGNCTAYGDSNRLEQVLYNLIGNAISHIGENKTVRVSVVGDGASVRVSVRDYGSGIAPEELDKVWDRYYRSGQNKRNLVGSGLGLSIVKSILTAHNARYGVSSRLGEGTEFWFELDAVQSAALPAATAEDKAEPKKHRKTKN